MRNTDFQRTLSESVRRETVALVRSYACRSDLSDAANRCYCVWLGGVAQCRGGK